MTKVIREYKKQLDAALEQDSKDTDWEALSKELLAKITFYQHERIVHLIVTMTMSLLLVLSVLAAILAADPPLVLLVLIFLFLVLTAPYLVYYYMLENAVQDIYKYYDKISEKIKKG